jgi:hypothetical protein
MNLTHYMAGITDSDLLEIHECIEQAKLMEGSAYKTSYLYRALCAQWYERKAAMTAAGIPIRSDPAFRCAY